MTGHLHAVVTGLGDYRLPCGCEGLGVVKCEEAAMLFKQVEAARAEVTDTLGRYLATGCTSEDAYEEYRAADKVRYAVESAYFIHYGEQINTD